MAIAALNRILSQFPRPRSGRKHQRAPRRDTRLTLEALDDRVVPAVFNVTTTADVLGGSHLSLRQAILNSNNTPGPNTINLTVPGVYKLTRFGNAHDGTNGALQIVDRSLTINGKGAGATLIDGGGVDRVFDIERVLNMNGPFSVAFNGVTIRHGLAGNNSNKGSDLTGSFKDGGGIYSPQVDLRLNHTVVADNVAERFGGGIWTDTGSVTINGGAVRGNIAFLSGGGLFTEAGAIAVTKATFADNGAGSSGGALIIDSSTSTGNLTLVGGLFTRNTSEFQGGAIADFSRANKVSLLGTAVVNNTAFLDGGGIYVAADNFTIDRSTISDNHSDGDGGGIYAADNTRQFLSINNTTIAGNTADSDGGGINSDAAQAAFNGDSITNNFGHDGGGIAFFGTQVTLSKSHVDGNRAANQAGGLDVVAGANSSCSISDSTFNNNRANSGEGGVNVQCATLTVSHSTVNGNRAGSGQGGLGAVVTTATFTNVNVIGNVTGGSYGGLYLVDTTLTMTGCAIRNNRAGGGVGGLFATQGAAGGTATISNTVISGNRASGNDGGMGFNGTQLNLVGATITNNFAGANDGGVFVSTANGGTISNTTIRGNRTAGDAGGLETNNLGGTLTISGCCISDNHAGVDGGGLFDGGTGAVTLINDTFFGNTASINGGGIATEGTNGTLSLQNVTIDGNAAARGGGIFNNTFLVLAHNSIIAGNRANQGPDVVGVASQGFNLIGIQDSASTTFVDGANHDQVGTVAKPKIARLGTLQNNGGATFSQKLLHGSPAIDQGDSTAAPAADQRGVSRPRDGDGNGSRLVDIGAFEK